MRISNILFELEQIASQNKDLSIISYVQPVMLSFEFFGSCYLWNKNINYLLYYFSNNNEEYNALCEFLYNCINECREEGGLIEPRKFKKNEENSNFNLFYEEYAKRLTREKNLDYFCGRDSIFISKRMFEKSLKRIAQTSREIIAEKFYRIFQKWQEKENKLTENALLFKERNFGEPILPKKSVLLDAITIKSSNNHYLQLELIGEFEKIMGKECQMYLRHEREIIYKTPVQIKEKNSIQINLSRIIQESSYLISIESSLYHSNPIQYDHHKHFPNIQKIKLNDSYKYCSSSSNNAILMDFPKESFWKKDLRDRNALLSACINENWEIVSQIIRNCEMLELDLNEQDEEGNTCLHYACFHGQLLIVKEMLQKGSNPNLINRYGESPIYFAYKKENIFGELLKNYNPKNSILPWQSFWLIRDAQFYNKFCSTLSQLNDMQVSDQIENNNNNPLNYISAQNGEEDSYFSMDSSERFSEENSFEEKIAVNYVPKTKRSGSDSTICEDRISSEYRRYSTGDQIFEKSSAHNKLLLKPILKHSTMISHSNPMPIVNRKFSLQNRASNKKGYVDTRDCFEVFKSMESGFFKVNWIPENLTVYQRWIKPVPEVQYDLKNYKDCCVEVNFFFFFFFFF